MENSQFLAQAFGIYLIVVALWCFVSRDRIVKIIREAEKSDALMLTFGIIALIIGILVVLAHNVWVGWPITITLLGYLSLLKGVIRLFAPKSAIASGRGMLKGLGLYITAIITLGLGIFLCVMGF